MVAPLGRPEILHASCVAHQGRGLLILGPSGAGKSTLALHMIALGAGLVADDRCEVYAQDGALTARPPQAIAGLIEARGLGILRLPHLAQTTVVAAIDLNAPNPSPPARLPQPQQRRFAGISVDYLPFQTGAHFPALLMCYLMGARLE